MPILYADMQREGEDPCMLCCTYLLPISLLKESSRDGAVVMGSECGATAGRAAECRSIA
jgi:hypothetical protein